MTFLWATIVVIGIIVMVHELGHYLAARSVGVRVERFSVGFPPRFLTFTSVENGWAFRLFFYKKTSAGLEWQPVYTHTFSSQGKKGSGTEYCLALIPLGGYVKMAGVIDESMDTNITHAPDEFASKSPLAQMWIMSAGVLMNIVLAFTIYTGIALYTGIPEVSTEPMIAKLIPDYPAEKAGLTPGDKVLRVNGESVDTWKDMTTIIHALPNSDILLTVEQEAHQKDFLIHSTFQTVVNDGKIDTLGFIGIAPEITYRESSIPEAIFAGVRSTGYGLGLIVTSVRMLITGDASMKDMGGPIMIAQWAGETAKAGWIPLLGFMALISVNLAFINILPIPALDGGHILITAIQAIIRKPISLRVRMIIQQIGMAFLLVLMITVIFNDVLRLFGN
ncbi:MAG: RIP metalloprotease RseP [Candidatus Marinimicrobia bacterium]|nr:RIP metalloprotease RseP [Candidatus Neomarinimicrobiota bacterium]